MRALWAVTIAFCVLVAGGRPIETRAHGRETARIDVAVHSTAASAIRRSGTPLDAQLRPLVVVPPVAIADGARPLTAYVLESVAVPRWHHQLVALSRSSRGPPQA